LTERAKGTFEVKVIPQPPDDKDDPNLGRFLLDKRFHGDLEGTSKGQMLTADTAVKGSGVMWRLRRSAELCVDAVAHLCCSTSER
jgi:hypothetical protein